MNDEINHILKSIENSKIIEYPFYHLLLKIYFRMNSMRKM